MRTILLFALIALLALPVIAQFDDDIHDRFCGDDSAGEIADILRARADRLDAGDDVQLVLIEVQGLLSTIRAICNGYIFTSEEYGQNVVTDLVLFADGIYRVTLDNLGTTFVSAKLTGFSDGCEFLNMAISGGGTDQKSVRLQDCTGLVEVGGNGDWVLTFEPIVLERSE